MNNKRNCDWPVNVLLLVGIKREDYYANQQDIEATLYYLVHSLFSARNARIFVDTMRDHKLHETVARENHITSCRVSQLNEFMINELRERPGAKEMLRLGIRRYYDILQRRTQENCKDQIRELKRSSEPEQYIREYEKNTYILDLPMAKKTIRSLGRLGVETVGDMLNTRILTGPRLIALPGVGAKTYNEVGRFMIRHLGALEVDWPIMPEKNDSRKKFAL